MRVVRAVGDEVLVGDQTFQYFTSDIKTLQDDSIGSTSKVSRSPTKPTRPKPPNLLLCCRCCTWVG